MKFPKVLALLFALAFAALPLAACSSPTPTYPVTTLPLENNQSKLDIHPMAFKPADQLKPGVSQSLEGFSLDLFQRMAAQDAGKNVFVSPLSVWLALSMTYNGASGATAEAMAKGLHAQGISLADLNGDNAGLMGVLTAADPKAAIALANSIWLRDSVKNQFNQDFLDRDQQSYAAQIQALDFSDKGAADIINQWVEQNTNGNIKNLVEPPIDPSTVMYLINAIHFKAPWKVSFDPKKTFDGTFAASGAQVPAKFMASESGYTGYADENVSVVRIPYASGRLEMAALMPNKGTLAEFVKSLTPQALESAIGKCEKTDLKLAFPKFKLDYSATLNDALCAMGMGEAFDAAKAEFKNMSETMGDKLVISKVKHKSFIEVNEEGTEASAATQVEMNLTAVLVTGNLEFTKPFVYLIRDTKTGAILFIGTMEKPE